MRGKVVILCAVFCLLYLLLSISICHLSLGLGIITGALPTGVPLLPLPYRLCGCLRSCRQAIKAPFQCVSLALMPESAPAPASTPAAAGPSHRA